MINRGLTTTDGQPVVVLRPGELNKDSGPDFFNAQLQIGAIEWVGNVEIHIHTSDWRLHKHSQDAAYNNIILHVVYEHDCEIQTQNGNVPVTIELKNFLSDALIRNYDSLVAPKQGMGIHCSHAIEAVPPLIISSMQERLVLERLEEKAQMVRRMLEESHGGWEQTCYWLMARYFGGKVNSLAFELLAKATDLRMLARWKDDPQRLEAILMGQAGLLNGYFEDDYPRRLQADYEAIHTGSRLTPMEVAMWKFHRLRPSSFPTIRISQFAHLLSETPNLFSTLLAQHDVKEIERMLCQQAAPYWDNHYQFDVMAPRATKKRIGAMQAQVIIINAWVPLLFVYGSVHGQQSLKDQAVDLLMQLPAEDNEVMRRWKCVGVEPRNAAESQALLHLENNYCKSTRCLECRIGYYILKH